MTIKQTVLKLLTEQWYCLFLSNIFFILKSPSFQNYFVFESIACGFCRMQKANMLCKNEIIINYCGIIIVQGFFGQSASTWTWLKVMKNILIINLLSKWCSHMNIGPRIKMIPHYIQLILLGLIDTYPYDFIPGKSIPFTSSVSLVLGVVIKTAQYWFIIQQIFQFLQTLLQEITKLLNLQMNVRDYKWRKFSDIIRQKFSSPHFQYRCKTLQWYYV